MTAVITKPIAGAHTQITSSGASTANNLSATGGNPIANSTNLDLGGELVMNVGFGSAPVVGVSIDVYLIPKIDGVNYPDIDTSSSPPTIHPNYLLGSFTILKAQTGTQRLGLSIPFGTLKAFDYEVVIVNRTAQTMSAAWTLDHYGQQLQSA